MKRNLIWVSLGFLLLTNGFGSLASAQNLDPGMWHAETDFRVDGIPLPASTGDSCVTPEESKDARSTLTQNLDKIGCSITDWNVSGNNLSASLDCKSDKVNASGTIQGSFTAKSYDLIGHAHGFYQRIFPSVASLKLHGEWTGPCPEPTHPQPQASPEPVPQASPEPSPSPTPMPSPTPPPAPKPIPKNNF